MLRRALANLSRPIWWDHSQSGGDFHDAGDIRCADGNLERAQEILGEVVAQLICGKQRVVTIGGGHETAWGSFLGVVAAFPDAKVGVINLDAHLDVRPGAIAHSGTPFRQMADWHRANGRLFQCLCLGLAEHSNTEAAITTADSLGVEFKWDHQVDGNGMHWVGGDLERFMQSVDFLYLSLDLDVLSGWIMPAVSAPAGSGVSLTAVDSVIRDVMSSDKVVAVDVVEFNPTYDRDGIAARVASRLIWYVMERWKKAPEANHP